MNFSVVLIAKNEEKTLPRLLNSLNEFKERGGEIILVDTGSTDNTVKVAKDNGCKVTEVGTKFIKTIDKQLAKDINERFVVDEEPIVKEGDTLFDYASARNFAATLSSNDMIATPDCDEEYTKLDLDKVNELIANGAEQLEYNFVFSHDQFGNEEIKFLHSKFYNRTKAKWVGIIHEVLKGKVERVQLGEDVIKLEHWQNHETNRSGYLKGLAIDCFENPDNDRNSHYLGRELIWTGRPRSAIRELQRHLTISNWPAERSQSKIFIGDAHMAIGQQLEALQWYFKAIEEDPNRREPWIKLAEFHYKKKAPQQTACYCAAAMQIDWNNFYANFKTHYTNWPHEMMYWALWQLDRKEDSKLHFDEALRQVPTSPKYLHDYRFYYDLPLVSFVIPTLGRKAGLKKCLDSIKALNYPANKIEVIVIEDEPREGVPKRVKQGVEASKGEYVVYGSNDTIFSPESLIQAVRYSLENDKGLVAFNTGEVLPDEGNICEHFLISKKVIKEIGEVFDTDFNHVGVDNLLWAKCKKLNQASRCDLAVVEHKHFSKGAKMDKVYKLGWDKAEEDRALLKKKLAEL